MTGQNSHMQHSIESYSEELVFVSDLYHRLYINITMIEEEVSNAKLNAKHLNALVSSHDGSDPDDGEEIFEYSYPEQISSLQELMKDAGQRLRSLLKKESKYPLEFSEDYPAISRYPDWIGEEIFPYHIPSERQAEIINGGGSIINFVESNHDRNIERFFNNGAVPSYINESFIRVWWPIAAMYSSPGYLKKVNENTYIAYSLER